jgi:tRNA-2-methylthio-N6-dimethylallyladenosine synthase
MVDNVTMEQKKDRFNRLVSAVTKSAKKRNDEYVGKTIKVLVEGVSKKNSNILSGYSEENKLVNFKGDINKVGSIVKVKIHTSKTWTLEGEEVE